MSVIFNYKIVKDDESGKYSSEDVIDSGFLQIRGMAVSEMVDYDGININDSSDSISNELKAEVFENADVASIVKIDEYIKERTQCYIDDIKEEFPEMETDDLADLNVFMQVIQKCLGYGFPVSLIMWIS